jgi:predicted AAA+ superfamily ATPase
MTLKGIPFADQTFADIIDGDFFYADKTEYIYKLIDSKKKHFFLSRPRRFGKTLLINTLEELFSGRRELFQGLLIDKLGYDFPKRAVISFSLSIDSDTEEILKASTL